MEALINRFAFALIAGLVLVPLVRLVATRLGFVARPSEDRWHKRPTPLLGGVAIASVVLIGGLTVEPLVSVALLLACGAVIAAVGLVDDVISLKSSTKLIAEIVIASVFVYCGYRLHWTNSLTLDTILTLVWIVGLTNALNLLDNMDGLCAGVGLIAGGALLLTMILTGPISPEAHLLALLMGALVAFLIFNVYPASIFMGDTGSLFVGLMLATISISAAGLERNRSDFVSIITAPVLVMLIPIFDTTLVTVSRLMSGRKPSQGGRDHSSHRLVALGLSEKSAVMVLWCLALVAGLIGVGMRRFSVDWAGLLAGVFVLAMVIFAVYLAGVRIYESARLPRGTTLMFVDFMYKRRFAEVILDFCLVCMAYYSAYRLRFEGPEFTPAFPQFLRSLPVAISLQLTALFLVGAYRATWQYFGLMDAVNLGKGVVGGTAAIMLFVTLADPAVHYSRSTFVIYAAVFLLLVTLSRASFRLMGEFVSRRTNGPRVIIYTAATGQQLVARGLLTTLASPSRLLGFVCDEPERARGYVHGYPVLGGYDELLAMVSGRLADEIVVCLPHLDPNRLEELAQHCHASRVRLSQLRYSLEPLSAERRPLSRA